MFTVVGVTLAYGPRLYGTTPFWEQNLIGVLPVAPPFPGEFTRLEVR